jgi:hypothetical protein
MIKDVLEKRILVDGRLVSVPSETTPGQIIQTIGKDPNATSLVSRGDNGTTQYLPTKKTIRVRDGQELESAMSGIGG